MIIDPNANDMGGSGPRPKVRPGRKLVHAVGVEFAKSMAGNPKADVRFVVISDPDETNGQSDVSGFVWLNFVMIDSALWKLQQMSRAVGWTTPFDTEDQKAVTKVLMNAPIWVELELETYNGKQRLGLTRRGQLFSQFGGEMTEAMQQVVKSGVEYHKQGAAGNFNRQSKPKPPQGGQAFFDGDDIPF